MPSRAARALTCTLAIAGCLTTSACDKLGLGKKDPDGGTTTTGGGFGGLSFLGGGTFEGEITMNVTGHNAGKGGGPHTMIMGVKSPKLRIDTVGNVGTDNPMLAQGAGFIIDPPAKKAYMLMPAQKKAVVIDFEKMKALRGAPGGRPGPAAGVPSPADPPKIEKTGKKEVIAGYECEDWKITSKTSHADLCVAEGIKWIDLGDLGLASPEATLAIAASDLNHFPLKVVSYDDKNVETTRMEATKIDKKKLDDARFTVPPDFQLVDMSAMLGGLQGIGSGRPPGFPPGFVPPQPKR